MRSIYDFEYRQYTVVAKTPWFNEVRKYYYLSKHAEHARHQYLANHPDCEHQLMDIYETPEDYKLKDGVCESNNQEPRPTLERETSQNSAPSPRPVIAPKPSQE